MKLPFLNRQRESRRLTQAFATSAESHLAIVYGRRRLGKSTLLQHILRETDIYYLAAQQDRILQRQNLVTEIARTLPGFDDVMYPTWEAIFTQLARRCRPGTAVILDEFPYLVAESPELPSILQNLIDTRALNYHLALCGSSHHMMYGLASDHSAPLYGRAQEIIKLTPLPLGWLQDAIYADPRQCIEAYAVWGGVPRYWELASDFHDLEAAVKDLVLDRHGVLHQEPQRILLDDMHRTAQTNSLIAVIALGAHRLSEIGARLQKPATNLNRPLANLIDLGYLRRDIPFGESRASSKRTLYTIADPYLQFWYRFVFPHLSLLEVDRIDAVVSMIAEQFRSHVAAIWEELARTSCAYIDVADTAWNPGARWWGRGRDGQMMEIDVLAEALDRQSLLVGEVKWGDNPNPGEVLAGLQRKIGNLPFRAQYQTIVPAVWLKYPVDAAAVHVVTPERVCQLLR